MPLIHARSHARCPAAAGLEARGRGRTRRLHDLCRLLPLISEGPEGARFARCVFACSQEYHPKHVRKSATPWAFCKPRESVWKVGSATLASSAPRCIGCDRARALDRGVCAECRVSSEQQVEEGVSLEAQRTKLRAYALATDLDLVAIDEDAGVSGKSIQARAGLLQALARLEAGEADGCVATKNFAQVELSAGSY